MEENRKKGSRTGVIRSVVILLIVGFGVHILLPQIATFSHSIQIVRGMPLWIMGLAVLSQTLSYLGSGILLRGITSLDGCRISALRGMMINLASASVGLVAGGLLGSATTTYRWMRGSNASAESAMLAGWLPGVIEDLLLILLALIGIIHLLITHDLTLMQVVSFFLVLGLMALIAGVILWARQHRPRFISSVTSLLRKWAVLRGRVYDANPVRDVLNRLLQAIDDLVSGGWRRTIFGASLNIFFDMATLYFLFMAAGHAVRPGVLLVGYGLPLLFGKLPLLPGGIGIVEGTMAALYDGLGVPDAVTVVVVLTYRLLSFWLPLIIGFPLIPILQGSQDKFPPDTADRAPGG